MPSAVDPSRRDMPASTISSPISTPKMGRSWFAVTFLLLVQFSNKHVNFCAIHRMLYRHLCASSRRSKVEVVHHDVDLAQDSCDVRSNSSASVLHPQAAKATSVRAPMLSIGAQTLLAALGTHRPKRRQPGMSVIGGKADQSDIAVAAPVTALPFPVIRPDQFGRAAGSPDADPQALDAGSIEPVARRQENDVRVSPASRSSVGRHSLRGPVPSAAVAPKANRRQALLSVRVLRR